MMDSTAHKLDLACQEDYKQCLLIFYTSSNWQGEKKGKQNSQKTHQTWQKRRFVRKVKMVPSRESYDVTLFKPNSFAWYMKDLKGGKQFKRWVH